MNPQQQQGGMAMQSNIINQQVSIMVFSSLFSFVSLVNIRKLTRGIIESIIWFVWYILIIWFFCTTHPLFISITSWCLVHISELLILHSLSSRVGWWTPGWCRSSSSRCRRPAAWWPASSSRWSWCPADSRNTQIIINNKYPTPLPTIGRICCFKKSKDPSISGRITL